MDTVKYSFGLGKHFQTYFTFINTILPQKKKSQDSLSIDLRGEKNRFDLHKKLILPQQNLEKSEFENSNKHI